MNSRKKTCSSRSRSRSSMKKALIPVHKENESRIGKDIIDEVYKEMGFKP